MENKLSKRGRKPSGVAKVVYKRSVLPEQVALLDDVLRDSNKFGDGAPVREVEVGLKPDLVEKSKKFQAEVKAMMEPEVKIEHGGVAVTPKAKAVAPQPQKVDEPRHYSSVGGTYRKIDRPEDVGPQINQVKDLREQRQGAEPL